ncbi:peptide deformylase [Desulfurivibrio alkaliphilus]|uniref:Peptide deformylase n=1 Tax=Desulfurivibrio alkaliphilus (strain DSM 19089 / UNIQEM U267 / AHT2) TaxID=589865 RepID=D6YZR4_DESAT|nr:peptide deformylase [Desulfurivibrio alkaliphilus]ADH85071.1 peptide deformylase [Desulfurivibrio alkaliphilus AHT 2]
MAIQPIVQFPVPSLKSRAKPVSEFNDELRRLALDMIETMHAAPGVGLAAPQIGVPLRVVVIAGRVTLDEEQRAALAQEHGEAGEAAPSPPSPPSEEELAPSLVLINPEIVEAEGQQVDEEGCLSVREYATNVKRFARIRVKAQDLSGQPLDFVAEDFFARVIQHELDHLDGTLFIDRISPLKRTLYRKKLKKIMQAEEKP